MGNCQASEAATAVVHHPGGRVERLYWPTLARDLMLSNPGHYVALLTPASADAGGGTARVAVRLKLLRPRDMLVLGHVYRLVSAQEIAKGLRARKLEKMKMKQAAESDHGIGSVDPDKFNRACQRPTTQDKNQLKDSQPVGRHRQWHPSLESISEDESVRRHIDISS
ncbi:hypothetical protein QJS10_CPB17g00576 [Acorus calamus]|uniref:Uncharacterized protein n=1 Tax=Acorus calamus TaxID=4465 RepID=A0AAV9CSR6_ACOCL|nr:hypothetical protein QJS10_CPB17g00576 [Acorus calamus]